MANLNSGSIGGKVRFTCGDDWLKQKDPDGNGFPDADELPHGLQGYWDSINGRWVVPLNGSTCNSGSETDTYVYTISHFGFPNVVVICDQAWKIKIQAPEKVAQKAREEDRTGAHGLDAIPYNSLADMVASQMLLTDLFGPCTSPWHR